VQAVAQRAAAMPQLYDQRAVEERILSTLKIPNAEKLLLPATAPKEQNAVNENAAASMGRPIVAFPAQDHIAHLKTHLAYMMNPALGMNSLIAPVFLPTMLNHLKEHIALWYVTSVLELAEEVAGEDVTEAMKGMKDPEARQAFDRMLAEASMGVTEEANNVFASLPPIIQQAQQIMQQYQQPGMPQDPRIAVEQQKLQAQQQRDQQQMQLEGQKMQGQMQLEGQKMAAQAQQDQAEAQLEAQKLQIEAQLEQMKQDREDQRKKAELDARMAMNLQDNQTAMQLAAAEMASGERFDVSTGTGINPQP